MSDVRLQIYLLAENRLFREALTRILSKKGNIRVVGAAAWTTGVADRISEQKPDILLSDSTAILPAGRRVIPQLRMLLPELRIIMIGMDADREAFLSSVRQGATGYVLKDASAVEVAAAVRSVVKDEAVCPSSMLLSLFETVAHSQAELPNARVKRELGLSRREQQLVQMISQGLTNKEIAAQLNLSEQTVKNHVHRMLRKVGASDRMMIVERWQQVWQGGVPDSASPSWIYRQAAASGAKT
jgi:DNA-binding NarL/FixJ family response regulator